MIDYADRWYERAPAGPVETPAGPLSARDLRLAGAEYFELVRGAFHPPLAALAAYLTGSPAALRPLFPLTKLLGGPELESFDELTLRLAQELDIRLIDAGWLGLRELELPADAALAVAGHIAELLFYRRDLLDRLVAAAPLFLLYTTPQAFEAGGGVAGGCYRVDEGAIQLLLGRLYEGCAAPSPGVAPLLHELGHMLDCLDPPAGALGPARGLYPGLHPADGPCYRPEARRLFLRGKAAEAARYRRRVAGERDGPPPLGHPYVFQSDGEFLAGYLELFLRSPHGFAAQSPELFAGYVALFGYDPRPAWAGDFRFYLEQNAAYYAGGATPPPDGLTLPPDAPAP